MADATERLRSAIRAIATSDRELAHELETSRNRIERTLEAAPTAALADVTPEMAPAGEPIAMETIVFRTGRPVLAVVRNEAQLVFNDAESKIWKERLVKARPKLIHAIKAVGRIELRGHPSYDWVGTGWLVGKNRIVTNRHVASIFGQYDGGEFLFRRGPGGPMQASVDFLEEIGRQEALEFELDPIEFIEDESGPDLAVLRVKPADGRSLPDPIALANSMPDPERYVAVIGYPARDSRIPDQPLMDQIFGDVYNKKRLAPGQIKPSEDDLVLHDCSTLGGNSGSVVLDLSSGEALALHFSGRFLVANYAVPAAQIADRLRRLNGGQSRRPRTEPDSTSDDASRQRMGDRSPQVATQSSAGKATFTFPLRVTVEVDAAGGEQRSRRTPDSFSAPQRDSDLVLDEAVATDYSNRKGYNQDFLGKKFRVALPRITRNDGDVLTFKLGRKSSTVLDYEHFSVVMNEPRRLCFFSAVNIDGKATRKMARRGWRYDSRIPQAAQIKEECYGNSPRFSRGHMTRREDPIWGSKAQATRGGDDSMHVTNAVPQMQAFNAPVWLGLEDYALEHAREDDMKISVMTGPFLRDSDPEHFEVKIPRAFWKVIAFIHDDTGKLCATGYTMSQAAFLSDEEFVFGQFTNRDNETTQVALATIEQKAGLSFGTLAAHDPLAGIEGPAERPLSDFAQIRFF